MSYHIPCINSFANHRAKRKECFSVKKNLMYKLFAFFGAFSNVLKNLFCRVTPIQEEANTAEANTANANDNDNTANALNEEHQKEEPIMQQKVNEITINTPAQEVQVNTNTAAQEVQIDSALLKQATTAAIINLDKGIQKTYKRAFKRACKQGLNGDMQLRYTFKFPMAMDVTDMVTGKSSSIPLFSDREYKRFFGKDGNNFFIMAVREAVGNYLAQHRRFDVEPINDRLNSWSLIVSI